MPLRGLAARIAIAALISAAAGLAILLVGVQVVGAQIFMDLMVEAGDSAEHAREMWDQSVSGVVAVAAAAAIVASLVVAALLARQLARPLDRLGAAAEAVAGGDFEARVEPQGPAELASLGAAFNQMAEALAGQERVRRDFIANAAHELRTPLTNLQGYLEALRDGVIEAEPATYASLIEEVDRLVRLSRSLDELAAGDARREPPERIDLDLAVEIRRAIELAQPAADRAGLRLVVEVPEPLPARASPDELAQVLANLLSNAVRHAAGGGVVRVTAERRAGDVVVRVANTAAEPIPAAELERVFERFYRVEKSRDRSRGGAGIGLAIVRQLVEAGGGRVGAESAAGLTTFWFSLPA